MNFGFYKFESFKGWMNYFFSQVIFYVISVGDRKFFAGTNNGHTDDADDKDVDKN